MPSLEGLKTWFEYEVAITTAVLVAVVLFWSGQQIVTYLETLHLTAAEFALSLTGFSLAAVLLLLWWAGRYD